MTAAIDLEIYLLSKMNALRLVADALDRLGVLPSEMRRIAHSFKTRYPVEESIHPAKLYADLLGAPVSEVPAVLADPFIGSVRRCYSLRCWPEVLFVVNEHPQGYAWGVRFEQLSAAPSLPSDVRPWACTSEPLLAMATSKTVLESWSDELDVQLELPGQNGSERYRAVFDHNLLQTWRQIS